MNVELLLQVKDRILKEEFPVIMESYFAVGPDSPEIAQTDALETVEGWFSYEHEEIPGADGINKHGCKTAGCIAGHALMIVHPGNDKFHDYEYHAMTALGISQEDADKLFFDWLWPDQFRISYNTYLSEMEFKEANQVVADRIDHFIATGE